jgi:hypothetical protein
MEATSIHPSITAHLRSNRAGLFCDLLLKGNPNILESNIKVILAPIDESIYPYLKDTNSEYLEDLLFAHVSYDGVSLGSPSYKSISGIKLGNNLDELAKLIVSLNAVKIQGISVVIVENIIIDPVTANILLQKRKASQLSMDTRLIIGERIDTTRKWYQERKFQIRRSLKDFTLYNREEVRSLAIADIDVRSVNSEAGWDFVYKIWRMVRGYFHFDPDQTKELLRNIPISSANTIQQAEELFGLRGARDPSYEPYGGAYITFRYMPTTMIGARGDFRYAGGKLKTALREGYDLTPVSNFYNQISINSTPKIFDPRLDGILQKDDEYKWLHFVWDGNHRLRAYDDIAGIIPLITLEPFQSSPGDELKIYLIPPPFAPPFEPVFDASDMEELRSLIKTPRTAEVADRVRILIQHGKKTHSESDLNRYGAFRSAVEYLAE